MVRQEQYMTVGEASGEKPKPGPNQSCVVGIAQEESVHERIGEIRWQGVLGSVRECA